VTAAQVDAFKRIEEIMREHFTAAVLVVEGENDDKSCDIRSTWNGGYSASIGLLEMGKMQAWHEHKTQELE
jgi:hypothetical protein